MYLSTTLIIATLSLFAEARLTSRSGVAIPITKRMQVRDAGGVADIAKLQRGIRHSLAKIDHGLQAYEKNTGAPHPSAPKMKRADLKKHIGNEPLTNENFNYWYGSISVGTPAKNFKVVFDTGSALTFLPGSDCDSSCKGHALYNPAKSSTGKNLGEPFETRYGNGSIDFVDGMLYTDDVAISGYTAKNQTFGVASHFAGVFSADSFLPDGLVGLAFPSISPYQATPFFLTLAAQGSLPSNSFGFYLANEGSELFLGGTNDKLHGGDFTYVPVTKEGYWETNVDAIYVNGRKVAGVRDSIIDTGTTIILGDAKTVKAIYKHIPGSKPAPADIGDGLYTFPCSFNGTITVQFGRAKFVIAQEIFNQGALSEGSNDCVGGIGAIDDATPFWIIGDVFLQNVYTVFDVGKKRIGFANLK
ncbi:acid protease [Lactarius deliciosus]|nr:acid protease [Lactarius deliciosus]